MGEKNIAPTKYNWWDMLKQQVQPGSAGRTFAGYLGDVIGFDRGKGAGNPISMALNAGVKGGNLDVDYLGDNEDRMKLLNKWVGSHLKGGGGDIFSSYGPAGIEYHHEENLDPTTGKAYPRSSRTRIGELGFKEHAASPALNLMNTLGTGKLGKDDQGNLFMYDDYIYGNQDPGAEGATFWGEGSNKAQWLENLAMKVAGTNVNPDKEGKEYKQYEGYIGNNPNAQPKIQHLGNLKDMGLLDYAGQVGDIRKMVPDIEKHYSNLYKSEDDSGGVGTTLAGIGSSIKDFFTGGDVTSGMPRVTPRGDVAFTGKQLGTPVDTASGDARAAAKNINPKDPESVRRFQQLAGITADGKFGAQTLRALRAVQAGGMRGDIA